MSNSNIILIVDFWNKTPHLETSLELAYNHLLQGDEVYYYYFGDELKYNPRSIKKSKCCKKIFQPELIGIRKLKKFKLFNFNKALPQVINKNFKVNESVNLIDLEIDEINLGRAIIGQIAFDKKISVVEYYENKVIVKKMIRDTEKLYPILKSLIENGKFSLCYIFNGRFLHYNLLLRLCEKFNMPFLIHERGSSKEKFYLEKHPPHNNIEVQKGMLKFENSNLKNTSDFFENNLNRIEKQWFSFTKHQHKGLSFKWKWNDEVKKVAFFTSSNDENIAMDHIFWDNKREWESQEEVINFIYRLSQKVGFEFVVRIHPHLLKKCPSELERFLHKISEIPKSNIILPESKIDTYKLIADCNFTITAGSTVGIESVYWGKPTITTSSSFYSLLDCDYQPLTFIELENLIINSEKLQAKRDKTILYGEYMSNFGIPHVHYVAQDLYSGNFLGRNLQKSDLELIRKKVLKIINKIFK